MARPRIYKVRGHTRLLVEPVSSPARTPYGDFGFQLISRTVPAFPERPDPGMLRVRSSTATASGSRTSSPASLPSPNDELKVDGSYFFNTGNAGHELKVGGRFRNYEVRVSDFAWPGTPSVFDVFWAAEVAPPSSPVPRGISDSGDDGVLLPLGSGHHQPSGAFTINVGLRYDNQRRHQRGCYAAPAPSRSSRTILPAVSDRSRPSTSDFDWTNDRSASGRDLRSRQGSRHPAARELLAVRQPARRRYGQRHQPLGGEAYA